jgi:hypothetical protein
LPTVLHQAHEIGILSILLEFQSTFDRLMAVRLLTYIGLLYEDLHRSKAIGPDDPLPPVLPIVLYNRYAHIWVNAPRLAFTS